MCVDILIECYAPLLKVATIDDYTWYMQVFINVEIIIPLSYQCYADGGTLYTNLFCYDSSIV